MQALILAGGQGTRLRPLTLNTPKPVVPIGNEPFLLRQIKSLKAAGVTDITLSLNYQPSAVEKILGDGTDFGVELRYLIEPEPMGTAGGYKFAEKILKTTTVVLNGDILTDIDLETVARHHRECGAAATIVLTEVENPSAYGVVEFGADYQVLRFLEKPKPGETGDIEINTINAGIYILEPKLLDYIPRGENYSFEYNLFPDLLRRREKFYAFVENDAYWLDIGTPQRYLQAHYDFMDGKLKNFPAEKNGACKISDAAAIDGKSCLADGCIIEPGARLENSVLGKNVVVESGAVVENSVIWSDTKINSNARVSNSIIGFGCNIGENVRVGGGSVIGDRTNLY